MAKAANVACVGVAVGVMLAGARGAAARPPVLAGLEAVGAQAPAGVVAAYTAFNGGRDSYRRADYELAAVYLQQAEAAGDQLPPAERQELSRWIDLNSQALQARREGAMQLRRAELALQAGQHQAAETIFRALSTNQFLSPTDKAKVLAFAEHVRQGIPALRQTVIPETVSMAVVARDQLHEARALMVRGDYDTAEALASQASHLAVEFHPGEDTPRRVLEDLAQARKDARGLLGSARSALQRGEYDLADRLAQQAQKAGSAWTFRFRGDSPARVLKEIEAARGMVAVITSQTPARAAAPADADGTARMESRKPAEVLLATPLAPAADVLRTGALAAPLAAQGSTGWNSRMSAAQASAQRVPVPESLPPEDVKQLYEQAQRALQECQTLLQGARPTDPVRASAPTRGTSQTERGPQHGPEDPQSLLQKARWLYELGRFNAAESVAYYVKAVRPDGWDPRGDRPDDVLMDVRRARLTGRPSQALASQPAGRVVRGAAPGNDPPTDSRNGMFLPTTAGPDQSMPAAQHARQLLTEARQLQTQGRLVEARQRALVAQTTCNNFSPGEDNPEDLLGQLASTAARRIEAYVNEATRLAGTASSDEVAYRRTEEALLQARQLSAGFGLDCQPIDAMTAWVRQSRLQGGMARTQTGTPSPGAVAAGAMSAAGSAAPGTVVPAQFQQDVTAPGQPSAAPLTPPMVPTPVPSPGALLAPPPAPTAVPTQNLGQKMLADARLELKRGEIENARRLAEQAYANPAYGVQGQAQAVLRTVAAAEYNQRALVAGRSFEAGMSLYRRKEYAQAAAVFRNIEPGLLTPERTARLRELMQTPGMQTHSAAQIATASPAAGRATATDASAASKAKPDQTYAQQVQAMQDIQFQALREKAMRAQREATARAQANEIDQACDILQGFLDSLRNEALEPDRLAMLRGQVERRLQQFRGVKAQHDVDKLRTAQVTAFQDSHIKQVKAEDLKQQQVGELLKQYGVLYRQGKFAEAEVAAQKAHELDPDNAMASADMQMAHIHRNVDEARKLNRDKADFNLASLNDAERPGPAADGREPLKFDKDRWDVVKGRKGSKDLELLQRKTDKERDIEHRLHAPTSLDFKDAPLKQVLDDLSATNQINIVPDTAALEEAGISLDRPMSLKLESVELKSALNLLLAQAHLTYVLKDEVLSVTTEAHARGRLVQRVYQVGDIIIPVENHVGLDNPIQKALEQGTGKPQGGAGNYTWQTGIGTSGVPVGSPGSTSSAESPGLMQAARAAGISAPVGGKAASNTMEGLLIDLITNTIGNGTWSKVGGPGTIDYYPLGMALVVTQTPDIQEQVADLLQALRRLQDLEVAVEVRFITLDEAFYERIGVNFNLNIVNRGQTKYESQLVNGAFAPAGFLNAFRPDGFFTGLQAPNTFTSDLGVPIRPTSFGAAIPPFGGFPNSLSADGGLSLGMAFLSDIQVFMFLEAAQADRRTNVMQAPKLTMFNGQTSSLQVADSQFFVTGITVTGFGGQLVFDPQNSLINTGVFLTMQTVVSADRRFVRVSLAPTLTNVASPVTALFPVTAFITPVLEGGVPGPPVPFTQFVQQPTFTTVNVATTVSVPDGGTVLLGGLKTLREGRNEFGPPILSKLPYINRLFKNVGYGRETESLLIMVTPRIIINEEEEVIQTGEAAGGPR